MKKQILMLLTLALPLFADAPSTHGMLVFGKDAVYASHLPMFHSPHDYQWIFELSLPEGVQNNYVQDKIETGEPVYTLVPDRFSLPEMVESPVPFKAQLYRGHFERGGTPITEKVTVSVKKTLFFKKFSETALKPGVFQGLVFGTPNEIFVAHQIFKQPDFDQIVQVKSNPQLQAKVGSKAVPFYLRCSPNNKALSEGNPVGGTFPGETGAIINVHQVVYTEFGELE